MPDPKLEQVNLVFSVKCELKKKKEKKSNIHTTYVTLITNLRLIQLRSKPIVCRAAPKLRSKLWRHIPQSLVSNPASPLEKDPTPW